MSLKRPMFSFNNGLLIYTGVFHFGELLQPLVPFEIVKVTAAIQENALDKFFTDDDIPWSNLVGMMMDSCARRAWKQECDTTTAQSF